jgi:5-methylcytosine-specific restriction endonuclease McrA
LSEEGWTETGWQNKFASVTKPPEYDQYINSAQWRNISALMKKIAGNKCAHCRRSSSKLEVHHLTYKRFGHERMTDLVVLCESCHETADKKRVAEREARGRKARYNAAYDTYMTKKYGEGYDADFYLTYDGHEKFAEWLEKKSEEGD